MRDLSEAQAKRCERATTPRCKCRCAGRFHGAKRAEDVRTLPEDDPHRPAERRSRRAGPVDRATRELDEQLATKTAGDQVLVDEAMRELEPQLAGVDAMRSAYRKVFGGGAP